MSGLLVYGLLEMGALAALWALSGHVILPGALQAERTAIGGGTNDDFAPAAGVTVEADEWRLRLDQREILHPYIGFVEDPQGSHLKYREQYEPEGGLFGFPRNRHRLFHQPSDDLLVVAVVGGSVSRQVSFGAQRHLEQRLGEIERFRGRRVEVLSLGLGGHKQPQQVMVVNYFLTLGMHVDILVNVDGFNEVTLPISDNLASGVNPFFPRIWGFRVGAIDPVERRLRGEVELLKDLRRSTAAGFSGRPWRFSLACGLIWRLADRSLVGRIAHAEQELLARGPQEESAQAKGPPYEASSPEALHHDLAQVWARSSLQLHHLAAACGIEYYHFLQPNQYDPGGKRLTRRELELAYDPGSPFRGTVAAGYPALRRAAKELRSAGVAFTDLSDLFNAVPGNIYVDTCCHVNGEGATMMVDRIAAAVAAGPAPATR
jgi:hypothetical protein